MVSIIRLAVGLVRSILLARALPVETFGIYAYGGSVVAMTAAFADSGMSGAFLYRAPETENEEQAARVYFTSLSAFASAWALCLGGFASLFTQEEDRIALLLLTLTQLGAFLAHVPQAILVRRVVHRRLALIQITNVLASAIVAVLLAWRGRALWALLPTNIIALIVNMPLLYAWRPVWRPRWTWQPEEMRYFLRFGIQNRLSGLLLRALDRVDDLSTDRYLGDTPRGLYSRAYAFATYPRALVAEAANKVAGGTYAELKNDRKRLSQALFRSNAFLVRTGFLMRGLLFLTAPELVRLMLGAKWLPMLHAFRLMLVCTLLDPVKTAVGSLFVAVGTPQRVVTARGIQLVVLITALFIMGRLWGIAGLALAIALMLIVGMGLLLLQVREYVDFSLMRPIGAPGLGLSAGLLVALAVATMPITNRSDWHTGIAKGVVFSVIYSGSLRLFERDQLRELYHELTHPLVGEIP